MEAPDRLTEQMEILRTRFRLRCNEQAEALLKACASPNVAAIQQLAHNIAGSAGLFGFPILSEEASGLSECCRSGRTHEILSAARAMSQSLADLAPDRED